MAPPDSEVRPIQASFLDDGQKRIHSGFSLARLLRNNVLSPVWFPAFGKSPQLGYAAAVILPALVTLLSWVLSLFFPVFTVRGLFLICSALLIAYFWGTGPGLLSALVQALLSNTERSFPIVTWTLSSQSILQMLSFLLVGILLCALISRLEYSRQAAQRARQHIELIARQLMQEKALAAKQTRELEAVFSAIVDELYVYDKDCNLRQINPAGQQFNPATQQQAYQARPLGERLTEFAIRDETGRPLPLEEMPVMRILRGEKFIGDQTIDIMLRNTDGRDLLFNVSGSPIYDEQGDIQGAVVMMRDMSARRALERENVARARQLSTLIDTVPDSITVFDQEGRILQMNGAAHHLLGRYTSETQRSFSDRQRTIQPRDLRGNVLDKHILPVSRILQGETISGVESQDVLVHAFTGEEIYLNITGAPLYDEQEQLIGGVAVTRDRTEHFRSEIRTRSALEALLHFAEELVEAGIAPEVGEGEKDTLEGVDQVARRLATLIGQILDYQLVGLTLFHETPDEPQSAAIYGLSAEAEQSWLARKPGFTIGELLHGTALEQRLFAGEAVVMDLTEPSFAKRPTVYERRRLLLIPMMLEGKFIGMLTLGAADPAHDYPREEIGLARGLAELATLTLERQRLFQENLKDQATMLALSEANRLMDEFIGIAGHELRTPLTTIKGSVQLALRRINKTLKQQEALSDEAGQALITVKRHLDLTERQIAMQNRLVGDLLDVTRIHANRLELYPDLCNLVPLVRESVEDQRYLMPARQIELTISAPEEVFLHADSDRIRQVISNYLSNALKYSDPDKSVRVFLDLVENAVRVRVQDEGPGLTSEQQQRIWERFYRVPSIEVRSGSGIGLGLGLHICSMIIKRQGGNVGVQSVLGQGSTFWFTLPLTEP